MKWRKYEFIRGYYQLDSQLKIENSVYNGVSGRSWVFKDSGFECKCLCGTCSHTSSALYAIRFLLVGMNLKLHGT